MKCPRCKKRVIHLVLNWFVCKGKQCGQLWQDFELAGLNETKYEADGSDVQTEGSK